ncbi:FGGY-family carbohydrate kinase [Xanthomonas campestris pv. plantaginis]|uniref:FGGY-family carbohydrate kinase n=1 Tax=Xanthomonas campestris TaxID=339 RepID=UPI002B23E624|nr:FGGY-family carbohydrate kinase [Xanthomonas campestris]MEA9607122.1 FGGY-family carbohydrate kinase [Xanthomonas campestris pv. plantaginis]
MQPSNDAIYIGVDVGTGSARAGLFDAHGQLLGSARHPIQTWHLAGEMVEQSSADIWQACVQAIRTALSEAGLVATRVAGIGFDATCSLVAVDRDGGPVCISTSGQAARDVIVWMDHRAIAQAEQINATGEPVLRYVGGQISPEMQTPKLLWLKQHLPDSYMRAAHFFDLADWLSWRATGSHARSLCTLTCKWTYVQHEGGWSRRYFERIGLDDLLDDAAARIGSEVVPPGTALGQGLSPMAASELGLPAGIAVGASLIDAHAGAIGTIASPCADGRPVLPTARLAYILGTSACVLASTRTPCFTPGVWGPYGSALVEGLWLNEGGQSAAGVAIDILVRSHPGYVDASAQASAAGMPVLAWLEERVLARVGDPSRAALLARGLHVLPDYLGNRSPEADPNARAVIAGLTIDHDLQGLEALYVAGVCGLGYGLADIIDALRAQGVQFDSVIMSGGASHSRLVRQLMADASDMQVHVAATAEPVLLGSAMLAAVASGRYADLPAAMSAMSGLGASTAPTPPDIARFHAAKRRGYHAMQALDRTLRDEMARVMAAEPVD